ncbi:MAG TPA: ABC transporter substrate-binding protein [Burkholderiales bacterium]|nr:ABC transporter substrate-binding protein [Burkholderiales bacterium]
MPITLIENFRAVFYAPFYACAALGAYRAEGLEVTMRVSAAAEKTLTTGDVSWGGPLRVLKALDGNPGAGYVAFCEVVGRDPFFLLGRTPNPQFELNELIGTRVAVVSEVPTPWICLQYDLRRAGIDPAAIPLTPARSMAENAAALRAGDVDVIQVFQPYARELIDAKAGHVWYAAANRGLTSYTTFNSTRGFIEKNPEAALRMTRAMYRTQKWIAAHDGRALAEAIAAYLPDVPLPVLAACCNDYKSLGLWNANPVMRREGLEWLRDAMLAAGYIKTELAFEQCVEMRFAEQAVRDDPPSM